MLGVLGMAEEPGVLGARRAHLNATKVRRYGVCCSSLLVTSSLAVCLFLVKRCVLRACGLWLWMWMRCHCGRPVLTSCGPGGHLIRGGAELGTPLAAGARRGCRAQFRAVKSFRVCEAGLWDFVAACRRGIDLGVPLWTTCLS